jgi:uncharacterized protein YggE
MVAIVMALVVAAVIAPSPSTAQTETTQDTVTVSAVGKVEGRPDLAAVNFGIGAVAPTGSGAIDELARRQDAVIDALENGLGLGDDAVRTGNISVRRNCRYDRNLKRTVCNGYRARTSVRAETRSLDQVGDIIDAGIAAGANTLEGVSFERTENDEALREALTQAMELARSKGETLAAASERSLGRVLVIEEGGAQRPIFSAGNFDSARGVAAGSIEVDPRNDVTSVIVVVTYALN